MQDIFFPILERKFYEEIVFKLDYKKTYDEILAILHSDEQNLKLSKEQKQYIYNFFIHKRP